MDSLNCLYFIEEEEILLNEKPDFVCDNLKIFQGEYLNKRVFSYFVSDFTEVINKEILLRIKYSDSFHIPLLGYSINSNPNLGKSFVFEFPSNTFSLASLISNNDLIYDKKLMVISELIALYEFENSRNLNFQSLTLNDLYFNKKTNKLYVLKYPLMIENKLDVLEYDKLSCLSPEIMKKFYGTKSKVHEEDLNSKTEAWNLGLLIYEVLEGKHFTSMGEFGVESSKMFNNNPTNQNIKQKLSDFIQNLTNNYITQRINYLQYNQYIKNLLKKLLKVDQKQRCCTKVIMQDWIKNFGIVSTPEKDKDSKLNLLNLFRIDNV